MRGTACVLGAALAAPACGQWTLVQAPAPVFQAAPTPLVFLSDVPQAPLAWTVSPAPAATVAAKPVERKPLRVLVEKHYLGGQAANAALPPYVRKAEDGEFDQIVREFHFTDDGPKADGLKAVPRDGKSAEPPAKMDLPKAPANSTGDGDRTDLFDQLKTKAPGPAAADATPNGGTGYLAAETPPKAAGEALAISAVPVAGVAKAGPNGTPLAGMELRFVHHAAAGKRHAEQRCKTDRKGEFDTMLEPGLWTVFLALPDGEFDKLGSAKVVAKGENRFRFVE